jgi:hypothetical protein
MSKKSTLLSSVLFISTCIFSCVAFAQAPDWLWAKNAIGVNYNYGTSVASDKWGNVYVAGSFDGDSIQFQNITLTVNNGISDGSIFVAKYDSTGNIIWAKAFGGDGDEWPVMTIDKNANIYITGPFSSNSIQFGSTTVYNASLSPSNNDIFIAKLDTDGNVIWATRAGSQGYDRATAITTDQQDNIYIAGAFEDTLLYGDIILINDDPTAGATWGTVLNEFVIKLDKNGIGIWGNNKLADGSSAIACDKNQNVYVTGLNTSAYNGNVPLRYIEKFDVSGNLLWTNMIDGNSFAWALDVDSSGNAYVSGPFGQTLHLGNYTFIPDPTSGNSYLVKYAQNGNVIWAKTFSSIGVNSLAADSSKFIYLTGGFGADSISIEGIVLYNSNPNLYGSDIYVLKCDTSGNVIWAKSAGGYGSDGVGAISTNERGNVFITGYYYSDSCYFGSTVFTDSGYNFYVAKLDASAALTISEKEIENDNFLILPNPTNGKFIIQFEANGSYQLKVFNLMGQAVFQQQINNQQTSIDLSHLSNGIYILNLNDGKLNQNKRLVIAK